MKKLLIIALFILFPIAAGAVLPEDRVFDYPGFWDDKALLDNYYFELNKDQRRHKERAVKDGYRRISILESDIMQKQDQFDAERYRYYSHGHHRSALSPVPDYRPVPRY